MTDKRIEVEVREPQIIIGKHHYSVKNLLNYCHDDSVLCGKQMWEHVNEKICEALTVKDARIAELEAELNQKIHCYCGDVEKLEADIQSLKADLEEARRLAGTMSRLRDKGERNYDALKAENERLEKPHPKLVEILHSHTAEECDCDAYIIQAGAWARILSLEAEVQLLREVLIDSREALKLAGMFEHCKAIDKALAGGKEV
jgi:hypothetical protein